MAAKTKFRNSKLRIH